MPVYHGIWIFVCKAEDYPSPASVHLACDAQDASVFGVYEFHIAVRVTAPGRICLRVAAPHIPVHSWREDEAAVAFVVGARPASQGVQRQHKTVAALAVRGFKHPGIPADLCHDIIPVAGFRKGAATRQQTENPEHHGTGSPRARDSRGTVPVGVSRPHAHHVIGADPYGPGIPVAPAGAGFPGDLPY